MMHVMQSLNASRAVACAAILMVALPHSARAGPIASGLLCARLTDTDRAAFAEFVRSRGKPAGDGILKIAGPVRDQGLCVRNLTVMGAFGVVVATGQACADDGKKFVASLASVLRQTHKPGAQAGELARFEVANGVRPPGELVVYRGRPAPQPRPDTRAHSLAYHCVRQDGGPQ
jgi:hypothetical protein